MPTRIRAIALAPLLVVMVVIGCAATSRKPVPAPTSVPGHVVLGPEVEAFRPCGSTDELWIVGDSEALAALRSGYRALAQHPYQQTFVELVGMVGPTLDCGFCENYPGSFDVQSVVIQRRADPSDCQ